MPTEITLGEHTLPVYAQRHAYLINRLGKFMRELQQTGDLEADDLLGFLQTRSYELLCVLVPNLEKRLPEYEFRGFSSREAMDSNDYDPEADRSPTLPEIRTALTVASTVNAFDIFLHLKALVDPKLVKSWISAKLAEVILESQSLPNSRSENGASDSMSSMTTVPISMPNED